MIAICIASPADAAPSAKLVSVHIVGRASSEAAWTTGATEARASDSPQLAVIGVARRGKKTLYVADDAVAPLIVKGKRVKDRARLAWSDLPKGVKVRWLKVEPHAWRQEGVEAPNGATTRFHSNVSTESGSFGKWLGYDEITYFETAITKWSAKPGARRHTADALPTAEDEDIHDGLGTMRYKVEVSVKGRVLSTAGADATDRFGILPSVHRVSIRRDDTILGYLTSYFLVPEVFGSAGSGRNHQTERFVGADCADVLTGAARRAGNRGVWHTNVAGLTSYATIVAGPVELDEDGESEELIEGVKVGDIIRIDYGGSLTGHTPRSWDHVALLFEDRSEPGGGEPNGKLDGFDLIVHMGHPRLEVEPVSGQSPAKIDVLRWSKKKMHRRRRSR